MKKKKRTSVRIELQFKNTPSCPLPTGLPAVHRRTCLAGTVLTVLAHGGTFLTVLHHDGIFLAVLKNTVLFKREADSRFLTVPTLAAYGIANFDGIPLPSRIRLLRRENRDGKIPEEYPNLYAVTLIFKHIYSGVYIFRTSGVSSTNFESAC